MHSSRRLDHIVGHSIAAVCGLLALFGLIIPVLLSVVGYYPNGRGWEVAERIAAKGGDAQECSHIIEYFIMIPTVGEQRANCVYEFAKLTKDPTACARLMPSEYGLDCIGSVWGKAVADMDSPKFYDVIPEPNCENFPEPLHRDQCFAGNAFAAHDPSLCSPIGNEVIRKSCTEKLLAWQKYPSLRSSSYFGKYAEKM